MWGKCWQGHLGNYLGIGESRLLIRVLPLPAMIDTREGNPNIILFMNQAFQQLIKRLPKQMPEEIEIVIDGDPSVQIIPNPSPQPNPKSTLKDFFKTRPSIKVGEYNVKTDFMSRREPEENLQELLRKAKKEQQEQVNREFNQFYYGEKNKVEKKQKPAKDKLKNLQRYKQLNQDKKPKIAQMLAKERQEKMRKLLLWQKKSKQAAEMIDRAPEAKPFNITFTRTEATEQISNEYIQFQQTNCSSFLRMILEQDLSSELNQPEKKKVPSRFSGNEEYLKIFQFLIVGESIASLHNSYRNFGNTDEYLAPMCVNMILSQTSAEGFQIFEMEEISGESGSPPHCLKNLTLSKHNLVLISSDPAPNLKYISVDNFTKGFLFLGCLITPESKEDLSSNVKAMTMVNKRNYTHSLGEGHIKGYVFKYEKISTFIREFLGIRNVQFDDLSQFIYNPSLMNKVRNYVCEPQTFEGFFDELESKFNSTQLDSIKQLCLRDRGIIMLQGPPGTGKTSTLLGVLSGQYHYIKRRNQLGAKKILVCTPSNTAIDHIIKRIVKEGLIGQDGKCIRPKILRTGLVETKDEDVRSVYLDDLSEKEVMGGNHSDKEQREMTLFELNERIKYMLKETRRMESQYKMSRNEELYKAIRAKISERQKLEYKAYELRQERIDVKSRMNQVQKRLICEAEIILTTLSSTGTERFASLKGRFSCLIVDEAGQCTEPNLMIALQLNVPKVLLIGDPCQLPATTFSPDSNVTLYNRSLFQRMIDGGLKPYFLDIQYRMVPQIRQFPSRMFYEGRLKDSPTIAKRKYPQHLVRGFSNKHVWFVDVEYGKDKLKDKSYMNLDEAEVVKRICGRRQFQGLSMGIITPYNSQKMLLKQMVSKDIFVNTIDSFQGQEKDVIIISCVRSSSATDNKISVGFLVDERRINVALTRSRFLLIVVGNAYTLGSNQIWHKFIDFAVEKKSYVVIKNQESAKEIISKAMKGKLEREEISPSMKWKVHKNLSRDVRKAERESITLQDFEDGEIMEVEEPIEEVRMDSEKRLSPQRIEEVIEQPMEKKKWDLQQAMQSTGENLKAKFGSMSFFDLIKKM